MSRQSPTSPHHKNKAIINPPCRKDLEKDHNCSCLGFGKQREPSLTLSRLCPTLLRICMFSKYLQRNMCLWMGNAAFSPWCCAALFEWEWRLLADEPQCVAAVSPEQEWDEWSWVCSIGAWFSSQKGCNFGLLFYSFYQVVRVLMEGGWESLPCSPQLLVLGCTGSLVCGMIFS